MAPTTPPVLSPMCSRCGSTCHNTTSCSAPFLRALCSHCNRMGHLASDCPQKRRQEQEAAKKRRQEREAATQKRRQEREAEVKVDDQMSVRSGSTVASDGDLVHKAQGPPHCGFCGAKRTEPKSKKVQGSVPVLLPVVQKSMN